MTNGIAILKYCGGCHDDRIGAFFQSDELDVECHYGWAGELNGVG